MNKRLIILFSCLAVVALVIVLMFAVFTVREIEVMTGDDDSFIFNETLIADSANIKMGASIFSISEKKAIENIEKNNPYVKVINIERKFPSKVRIHITQRIPSMAMTIKNSTKVLLIDRELKVLAVREAADVNFENTCLVVGYDAEIDQTEINVEGTFLDINTERYKKLLDIYLGFEKCSFVNERFGRFIKKIDLSDIDSTFITTNDNVQIEIRGSGFVEEQVFGSYATYNTIRPDVRNGAKIYNDGIGWKVKY